jgi:hypothetical protein
VINDFSNSQCSYGGWSNGEMNSSAWTYGNGSSSISATCGTGGWVISGTVGVATVSGTNPAGFGLSLTGSVYSAAASANVNCTAFDLSAYSGLLITLSSASGAISTLGIGVNMADGGHGQTDILVPTTATAVAIIWSQLGITNASKITGITGVFRNGASAVTVDLVVGSVRLQ